MYLLEEVTRQHVQVLSNENLLVVQGFELRESFKLIGV